MNKPYTCLHQHYVYAISEVFEVQLYKNHARVPLLRVLSIVNSDRLRLSKRFWDSFLLKYWKVVIQ